jgi:hypothetical protein
VWIVIPWDVRARQDRHRSSAEYCKCRESEESDHDLAKPNLCARIFRPIKVNFVGHVSECCIQAERQ